MPSRAALAMPTTAELVENPSSRLPVVLVLDTSSSMEGAPLAHLQLALERFLADVAKDEDAQRACELAVLTVGGTVKAHRHFALVQAGWRPALEADGHTPLGKATEKALDLLEARKLQYSSVGNAYFQPWLVLLTDGEPTDSIARASARVADLVRDRKLTVFPIATGEKANRDRLRELAGGVEPLSLGERGFGEFFRWLSASMSQASRSTPGATLTLPASTSASEWTVTL